MLPLVIYNIKEIALADIKCNAGEIRIEKITDKYMEFDWFPYTLVRTQCNLCGEFIQRIIRLALEDKL